MAITVKQHYRTVNGKMVLVHEHQKDGDAAHHAHDVESEFEKLFGASEESHATQEPSVDDEFEKLFGEQQVDDEFEKLFGEEANKEDEPEHAKHVERSAKAKDLNPGMVVGIDENNQNLVIDVSPTTIWAQTPDGYIHEYDVAKWDKSIETFKVHVMDQGGFEKKDLIAGLKVGDTKTINGKTYILNENHRWELTDESSQVSTADKLLDMENWATEIINGFAIQKSSQTLFRVMKNDSDGKPLPKKVKDALAELHPDGYLKKKGYYIVNQSNAQKLAEIIDGKTQAKPKAKPAKKENVVPISAAEGFPFTQIGPQKGSNPGGLYQDRFGKKWYIKFPPTEDHAKNELLASKLYTALGVAAPKLKLVKKDGKVGIASAFQDGLTDNAAALKGGAPGAKEGFGADAWLGNWDSAGLSFDNMPVDKDGNAVRIDVGGSLLYRAQGGPKGDAFGNVVTEIDSLRNPSVNAQTAAIFGGMTQEEIDASVAKVVEIPDDIIKQAVRKFGPGTDGEKDALAKKLIARKNYLAKRFPGAVAIAFPPKPDPAKLPVRPDDFPKAPDFSNWNGDGKGLSSKPEINAQNQDAADKIYALATAGNLTALKALTIQPVGGGSHVSMANHPSQHIRAMFNQCVCTLETIANPEAAKAAKDWGLDSYDGGDMDDLSAACKAYPYGVTKDSAPAGKRLGFWISIADVEGGEHLAPKTTHNVTAAEKAVGRASNAKMSEIVKTFMKHVKSSGSANQPYRNGDEFDHAGNKCRDVIAAAYENAAEFQEGAIIRKHIDFHQEPGMREQLFGKPKGHIFQNPGSMCCSLKPDWNWSGEVELEMVYAKGAKGLYNIGVGSHDNEGEVTTLPGQRFMILDSNQKGPKGKPWFKLLMLPPDPTYVDTLHQKATAA